MEAVKLAEELCGTAEETSRKLCAIRSPEKPRFKPGVTSAFEQGVFASKIKTLKKSNKECIEITYSPSPRLIKKVRNDELDAAYIVLPCDTFSLIKLELEYFEYLYAVIPAEWNLSRIEYLNINSLDSKPMFWFQRQFNPVWFDYMNSNFKRLQFFPEILPEPAEYDILLERIAFGDGWTLLPASFTKIQRAGIIYQKILESSQFPIKLGIVSKKLSIEELRNYDI